MSKARVALVTGGTGGIGTAICRRLAQMGHKVATNYRDEGRAKAVQSVQYWLPRVEASFGQSASKRYETQARFGLRHTENDAMRKDWAGRVREALAPLGLG